MSLFSLNWGNIMLKRGKLYTFQIYTFFYWADRKRPQILEKKYQNLKKSFTFIYFFISCTTVTVN